MNQVKRYTSDIREEKKGLSYPRKKKKKKGVIIVSKPLQSGRKERERNQETRMKGGLTRVIAKKRARMNRPILWV